jgi:hypothetical protein
VVLAPWWDDMVTSPAPATGGVYLELQGSAPNRRLVIEWRCDTSWNAIWTAYSERVKFQAVLYETSGKLEYRYGTAAAVAGIPYGSPGASASCGVKVSTSVSQPGNIRDFFGTSGSPAGSTGPFLTNLTVFRAGGSAIMWPADASNTTGLGAYNLHFQIVPVDPTYDYDGAPLCVASKSYEATGTVEVTVGSDTYGIVFPACVAGLRYMVRCGVANQRVFLDPDATGTEDKFAGPDIAGTVGKGRILTKATARKGDYAQIEYGGADTWMIQAQRGIWTEEA